MIVEILIVIVITIMSDLTLIQVWRELSVSNAWGIRNKADWDAFLHVLRFYGHSWTHNTSGDYIFTTVEATCTLFQNQGHQCNCNTEIFFIDTKMYTTASTSSTTTTTTTTTTITSTTTTVTTTTTSATTSTITTTTTPTTTVTTIGTSTHTSTNTTTNSTPILMQKKEYPKKMPETLCTGFDELSQTNTNYSSSLIDYTKTKAKVKKKEEQIQLLFNLDKVLSSSSSNYHSLQIAILQEELNNLYPMLSEQKDALDLFKVAFEEAQLKFLHYVASMLIVTTIT